MDDGGLIHFSNPLHFSSKDGRIIYFEGTYTKSFSRTTVGTPRYDYNQILYRLDLARISHTLSSRGGARIDSTKARADFAAGLYGYILSKAKSSGTQVESAAARHSRKCMRNAG